MDMEAGGFVVHDRVDEVEAAARGERSPRASKKRDLGLVVTVDSTVKGGRLDQAVAVYIGPLLDGIHISYAPEFERCLE